MIELTKYVELNIKINLWKNNKFDYFLPKDENGNVKHFPKQELVWKTGKDSNITRMLVGGAALGAKTFTMSAFFVMEHLSVKNLRSFIGRNSISDITESVLETIWEVCRVYGIPESEIKYNPIKHFLYFPSTKSRIDFVELKYYPSDPDYSQSGSKNYSYGWIEEAQDVHFKAYDSYCVRLGRQGNVYEKIGKVINKMFVTMNPMKNWAYHTFYNPSKEGLLPENHAFIQMLAKDNPTILPHQLRTLDEISDPIKRARLRDGIWEYDDLDNAIFKYASITRMFDDDPAELFEDLYITCDPARKGKDEAIIMTWHGYRVIEIHIAKKCKTTDIEDRIMQIQAEHKIPNENVAIDSNGVGGGVNDHIDGSFEFIGNSKPIIDFIMGERASSENPSPFDSLRDQVFWIASDLVNKNIPVFSSSLKIERFGEYTDFYTREDIKKEFRKEIEQICKESNDSDKKIKLTRKHEIAKIITRSTNFSDCWSMRFVFDCGNASKQQEFCIGVVPEAESDENYYYRKLQEAV